MKTYTIDEQLEQLRKRRKWYNHRYVTNAVALFLLPPVFGWLGYLAFTYIHPVLGWLIWIAGFGGMGFLLIWSVTAEIWPRLGRWIKRKVKGALAPRI